MRSNTKYLEEVEVWSRLCGQGREKSSGHPRSAQRGHHSGITGRGEVGGGVHQAGPHSLHDLYGRAGEVGGRGAKRSRCQMARL